MKSFKIFWLLCVGYSAMVLREVQSSKNMALDTGVSPRSLQEDIEFLDAILKKTQKNMKDSAAVNDIKIVPDLAKCLEADKKENNSNPIICVGEDNTRKRVIFYSASEMSEVNLTGFTLKSEEITFENYFESFLRHLSSQALSPEMKLKTIKNALKKPLSVQSIFKIENANIDESPETVSFDLKITGPEISEVQPTKASLESIPPNVIRCHWDAQNGLLNLVTQYFENSITVTMTDKNEIETEVKAALGEILSQYERVKRFMYDEPTPKNKEHPEHIKRLDCDKLLNVSSEQVIPLKILEEALKISIKKPSEAEQLVSKVDFEYQGKNFEIGCQQVGDENGFLILNAKIGHGASIPEDQKAESQENQGEIKQVFAQQSLYDLMPIVEAFYAEIAWMIKQIYGTESG